jgi:hypothetical protein
MAAITSTDAELECIQRFAAVYFNCFFSQFRYCYSLALLLLHLSQMKGNDLNK